MGRGQNVLNLDLPSLSELRRAQRLDENWRVPPICTDAKSHSRKSQIFQNSPHRSMVWCCRGFKTFTSVLAQAVFQNFLLAHRLRKRWRDEAPRASHSYCVAQESPGRVCVFGQNRDRSVAGGANATYPRSIV